MARPRSETKEASGNGAEVKAKVIMDTAGWSHGEGEKTQYADKGDVVMLPKEEFERLSELGAVEKSNEPLTSGSEAASHPGSAERAAEAIHVETAESERETARQQ